MGSLTLRWSSEGMKRDSIAMLGGIFEDVSGDRSKVFTHLYAYRKSLLTIIKTYLNYGVLSCRVW